MKKYLIFSAIFFISVNFIFSQANPKLFKDSLDNGKSRLNYIWRQVKISDDFFEQKSRGGYMFAIEGYILGYNYNPNYPELNYKLGISYLKSVYKPKSLYFLKKAYKQKKNVTEDILWQLALSYQYNYKFDSALYFISLYKNTLSTKKLKTKKYIINKKTQECKLAKKMIKNPANVKIVNFDQINTEFPEYCPVVNADESKIYFTARRPDCTGSYIDKKDGQFYEDIYVAKFKDSSWTKPQNIGKPLNKRKHDATVALSPDGNMMLIYRSGDLFLCKKKGNKWDFPQYLNNINTPEIENSACFSFDAKTIYFVRGKKLDQQKSNSDIYVTKLSNNKWSKPEKLPDVINTNKDEDGVYLHPDGRTLYFSSKGHNSMGGFDIFKSVKDKNGKWTKPINLGYPINTPDDDIYFVMSADGNTGYYSSVRKNSEGFSDIYKIKFIREKKIYLDTEDNLIASTDSTVTQLSIKKDIKTVFLTLVTGSVYDAISLDPLVAKIQIFDNSNDSLILETTTEPENGKYILTLPSGNNYGMNVNAEGYLFHSENFNLPKNKAFDRVYMDIPLYNISEGSKVILKNIFFDFDKSNLRKESIPELERVYSFLSANQSVRIEISGHTDNKGSYEYNKKLSQARAKSVVDYLIKKGIDKNRLSYRGASFDEPIADNETEEGRQLNRRVEFKITGS